MTNEKPKQCKSKGCYNPTLDGKYCNLCKQKRKENRGKILKGAGAVASGVAILVVSVVKNKDIINKFLSLQQKLHK